MGLGPVTKRGKWRFVVSDAAKRSRGRRTAPHGVPCLTTNLFPPWEGGIEGGICREEIFDGWRTLGRDGRLLEGGDSGLRCRSIPEYLSAESERIK